MRSVRYRTDAASSQGHAWIAFYLRRDDCPRSGRCIARWACRERSRHRTAKGNWMRMRFEGQAGVSVWIAGIFICLLVVSSTMAIVRSIPASYANTSDEGTPSNGGATSRGSDDAHANSSQTNSTVAQDTI